jgi:hypothetical protein
MEAEQLHEAREDDTLYDVAAYKREQADHAYASGHESGYAMVEEEVGAGFASRFGFTERNRQIEQVLQARRTGRTLPLP